MITITTNHDWATSVDDLRQGLINTINTEQEEYQETNLTIWQWMAFRFLWMRSFKCHQN